MPCGRSVRQSGPGDPTLRRESERGLADLFLASWTACARPSTLPCSGRVLLIHVAVHGEPVALRTRPREYLLELDRRIAPLIGVESDADNPVLVGQGLVQRRHRGLGGHVPKEAHDELGADTEPLLRVVLRPANSADHGLKGDAPRGVRLGVEEHLGVEHVLGMHLREVGGRQIEEVLLCPEDAHALVVDAEEGR